MFLYDWRNTAEPGNLVHRYFEIGQQEFSREAAENLAQKGDDLIAEYGSLHMALRAVQENKMREQHELVSNAQKHLCGNPELQADIIELHRIGAIPKYRAPTPDTFRVRGLPHNMSEEPYIVEKLWDLVSQGKMFVCTSLGIPVCNLYMVSPSTTVPKKLPDRTISSEKRVIWDGRRLNLKCPKGDYWAVTTPTVEDLARKYCFLRAANPGIRILGTKRDIDAAFTRCRFHPDCAVLFGAEFSHSDPTNSLVFFYLVLPFGFTGSPGIFCRIMCAVQHFHKLHTVSHKHLNGSLPLDAHVFIDDGMFMEPDLANRPQISVETWELGARLFLGPTGISEKKIKIEGQWSTMVIFLGFHIDLAEDTISLPNPKVTGAANLLRSRSFDAGNYVLALKDVQELRGCINHWACTGRTWKWLVHPINQMLGFADSAGVWIRCNDQTIWHSFWHAIIFMREIVEDEDNWSTLFTGKFSELAGATHELTLPNQHRQLVWFSADATPSCIGGINWSNKTFFVAEPKEYITPLCPSSREHAHISEIEFTVEVLCTVLWGTDNPDLIVCGLTDNTCSNMWIMTGKAKHGIALTLTRTFHKWLLSRKFRFCSFYIRSGHNISADFLSRASVSEIEIWAHENKMHRIHPLEAWLEFCRTNRVEAALLPCYTPSRGGHRFISVSHCGMARWGFHFIASSK